MADPHSQDRRTKEAEDLFFEFLAQRGQPAAIEFGDYCLRYPRLQDDLRRVYDEWAQLDRLVSSSDDLDSLHGRMEQRFGRSLDPGVDLHAESVAEWPSREVYQRLADHLPKNDRYAPRGEIARGGMGVILKVWDQDIRRNLAMKVLRRDVSTDSQPRTPKEARTLRRFLEEAQITGQLEHPGIVPVHELGLDADGRVYFTMPLVRGREFKEVIHLVREGRDGWNLTRALSVVVKVCEAMAYAHSKGVIHRDLKPANVMVGRFGETYVMDWGLARVLGRRDSHDVRIQEQQKTSMVDLGTRKYDDSPGSPFITMDGDVVGTPAYMSPEQASGKIDVLSPRSDVYAIGAMLYHLITGHMPYLSGGQKVPPQQVLILRAQGPPQPILELAPQTDRALVAIAEKAMATEPEQRYVTALELAKDLEKYLGGRPVDARGGNLADLVRLAYRNHRPRILAVLLVVLAVGMGIAFYVQGLRGRLAGEVLGRRLAAAKVLLIDPATAGPAESQRAAEFERWLARADEALAAQAELEHAIERAGASERAELQQGQQDLERLHSLRPIVADLAARARDAQQD